MKHILKTVILFLLCSCGIIAINENDYRLMPKKDLAYFKPFDIIKTMKNSNFDKPIFVLQDSYFGHKLRNIALHGYVLIPEKMLEDLENLAKYLDESYDYVMSLDPK